MRTSSVATLALMLLLAAAPTAAMAWTRGSSAAIMQAEVAAQARLLAQEKARREADIRLHDEQLARARRNAILRADALSAQGRQAKATEQAARAQMNLSASQQPLSTSHVASSSPGMTRLGPVTHRPIPSQFQGVIPSEMLKGRERAAQTEKSRTPEREKHAGEKGAKRGENSPAATHSRHGR